VTTAGTAAGADPDTGGLLHPVLQAAAQLDGVAAATWSSLQPDTAAAGADGPRVLLDLEPGVDAAVVAHAVGSVLRERFDVGINAEDAQLVYRCARIATQEGQPEVDELRVVTGADAGAHALVALRVGEGVVVGRSQSAATEAGVARAVAEATLYAVEEMTEDGVVGSVEGVVVPRPSTTGGADGGDTGTLTGPVTGTLTGTVTGTVTGTLPEVEVALLLDVAGHERAVSGRAAAGADVRQAVVRAVLAAVFDHLAE